MLAKRYFISGRVQGVGFRYFVIREVERIGSLQGYVRNLYDGRVEVFAQGNEREIADLEAALRRGPRSSRVEQLDESIEPFEDRYTDFRISH
jgi:acylphosphatase